ncbi:chemotaxis protein CheA [Sporomusa sp. KB1]|uniref:chemotaxis protein CheA n=1 Tax=Sporomusa sp. KB1 TaxID=943346 RepID=UPI00119D5693|nr:chemotaxis protein CheA [Sporomusa sp. KB1]TWH49460.1 two-component system chemotaxis sensor kinase CheA [Sporomusa sp. KB1]
MSDESTMEPMLELFLFETTQLVEQLEQSVIDSEKCDGYNIAAINEIFRIMHSIKGAAAMMMFDTIAQLAHCVEDVFFYLREGKPENVDYMILSDLILASGDFIKNEIDKIRSGGNADGNASSLIDQTHSFLDELKKVNPSVQTVAKESTVLSQKQYYVSQDKKAVSLKKQSFMATVFFEDGCDMENIRAYTIIPSLRDIAKDITYIPENIMEDDATAEIIRTEGFKIFFSSGRPYSEIHELLEKTIFLKTLELVEIDGAATEKQESRPKQIILEDFTDKNSNPIGQHPAAINKKAVSNSGQSMISVNVAKLDTLMDLVGELVVAEAMVIQNPDLRGLSLTNFAKAVRQLEKITGEMQDIVMSIRMLPLATTFQKMNRIIRDMCKKLGKEVQLELIGEETEVDKNIIEHISDPLMHIIRNAVDHGIESGEERMAVGKPANGKVTLEAKNDGSDVVILIKDDGRGLNRDKILKRAGDNGLLHKPENELTDKEIYSFIFAPGFSTNDKVTEFSGRGVGMDVVTKNINSIGGMVVVDSIPGAGTTISLRIPLTLAIVDAMNIGVGDARYTIPITAIKESFKPREKDIIIDPDGNEMIMVRGQCFPILRISQVFKVNTRTNDITDGIIIMVENEGNIVCLFADELIGEQQVVVKALPPYVKNIRQVEGLAGCTLLGDGSISLILDIGGMVKRKKTS